MKNTHTETMVEFLFDEPDDMGRATCIEIFAHAPDVHIRNAILAACEEYADENAQDLDDVPMLEIMLSKGGQEALARHGLRLMETPPGDYAFIPAYAGELKRELSGA